MRTPSSAAERAKPSALRSRGTRDGLFRLESERIKFVAGAEQSQSNPSASACQAGCAPSCKKNDDTRAKQLRVGPERAGHHHVDEQQPHTNQLCAASAVIQNALPHRPTCLTAPTCPTRPHRSNRPPLART